jgi:AraC family transcriptional regulator
MCHYRNDIRATQPKSMSASPHHECTDLANAQSALGAGRYYGEVADRFDTSLAVLSEVIHPKARSLPEHDHALAYFCMLVEGQYVETIGGRELDYHPFDVGFHPSHMPHRDTISGRGARFLCLEMRSESFATTGVRLDRAPALLPGVVTLQLLRVYYHFAARTLSPILLESAVWELCGGVSEQMSPEERRFPTWLRRCLDLIEGEYATDLAIGEIATRIDIHPVHLSREFRRRFGQTIGEYVHKVRIRSACALMSGGLAPLSTVAASVGFADQAHFCRVFKALVGCTPSSFVAACTLGQH